MIEAFRHEKRYLIFERELKERAEPVGNPTEGGPSRADVGLAMSHFTHTPAGLGPR
jgi:hypothetical protein